MNPEPAPENDDNPFRSPTNTSDLMAAARMRRRLINGLLTVGIFILIFVGWFGMRLVVWAFNNGFFAR